jgi:hypothetical protein
MDSREVEELLTPLRSDVFAESVSISLLRPITFEAALLAGFAERA